MNYPYDSVKQTLSINKKEISVEQQYNIEKVTTVWDLPELNCTDNLHQIYNKTARLYTSKEEGVKDIVLINDSKTKQFMALQIVKQVTICERIVFSTNTDGIYVAMNTTSIDQDMWYFKNLTEVDKSQVNPYSHVRSFLQARYITVGLFWSEAFSTIMQHVCENEKSIMETNLGLMDVNIDLSIFNLFGKGKYQISIAKVK